MDQVVDIDRYRRGARPGTRPGSAHASQQDVFFDSRELRLILDLYADMVAAGKWRDYAIAHDEQSCSFAVFRRSCDQALYRIVKSHGGKSRERAGGAYAVLACGGRVLARGRTLASALAVFVADRLALV